MKTKVLVISLILVLMIVASGYAAGADVVEINFVHAFAHNAPEIQQEIVDEFNRRNAHIRVTIETVPWNASVEILQLRTAAGIAPDVISLGSDIMSALVSGEIEWFTDLAPYIERDADDYWGDIPTPVWEATSLDGKIMALSQRLPIYVMFYNRAMFDEAGLQTPPHDWYDSSWNWEAFEEATSRLVLDRSGDGVPDVYGFANSLPTRFYHWVFQSGGDYLSEGYDDFILDQPEGMRAIEFMTSLIERNRMGGNFFNGTAAMYTGIPTEMKNAEEQGLHWDIAPLPQGPAGPAGKMLSIALGIPAGSANKEEAWEFLRYFTSAEAGATLNQADIIPQPRLNVVTDPRNYAPYVREEHLTVIAQALDMGRAYRWFHPNAPEIYETIDHALREIFALRTDPASGLASIRPTIMHLLDEH